jgi:phosphate starvation-inducible PhoH-like protein
MSHKRKHAEARTVRAADSMPLPLNDAQALMLSHLRTRQMVIAEGSAGTGKTFLAAHHAACRLLRGEVGRIVLLRPYVAVGKTVGMLPGTLQDKLTPLMLPMLDVLRDVLTPGAYDIALKCGTITLEAVENVRGRSYRNSVIIIDEAQNIEPAAIEAIVTRVEADSQLILIGDTRQTDIRGSTGIGYLADLLESLPVRLDDESRDTLAHDVGIVRFEPTDVVRSGLVRAFCRLFDMLEA